MNFQFYLEKLFASEVFENFIRANPDAKPVSAFFALDNGGKVDGKDKQHFDYFLPKEDRMVSFKLEDSVEMVDVQKFDDSCFDEIALNYDFDFSEISKLIEKRIEEENMNLRVTKLLFSMQRLEGKDYLVGTIFTSGLGMLRVHYDILEKSIVLFEKKSFFDMLKISKKDDEKNGGA